MTAANPTPRPGRHAADDRRKNDKPFHIARKNMRRQRRHEQKTKGDQRPDAQYGNGNREANEQIKQRVPE